LKQEFAQEASAFSEIHVQLLKDCNSTLSKHVGMKLQLPQPPARANSVGCSHCSAGNEQATPQRCLAPVTSANALWAAHSGAIDQHTPLCQSTEARDQGDDLPFEGDGRHCIRLAPQRTDLQDTDVLSIAETATICIEQRSKERPVACTLTPTGNPQSAADGSEADRTAADAGFIDNLRRVSYNCAAATPLPEQVRTTPSSE
jgi:hypothetical protein